MNTLPIIQNFFGRPVRFFRAEFMPELDCHNGSPGLNKYLLKTWAIPLPDYAEAIGYGDESILKIIQRNKEVFEGFYTYESIPDRTTGQRRRTLLMAIEMCDGLNMKLHTSRIKDPSVREMVIRFQRWVLFAFHLLRTGKVRPVRWCLDREIPPEYLEALGMPSGRQRRKLIKEIAGREGKSEQQIYRRLQKLSGANTVTRKGRPKRSPSHKGAYKKSLDYQSVLFAYTQWPGMAKKDIARVTGVSYGKVCRWLRAA